MCEITGNYSLLSYLVQSPHSPTILFQGYNPSERNSMIPLSCFYFFPEGVFQAVLRELGAAPGNSRTTGRKRSKLGSTQVLYWQEILGNARKLPGLYLVVNEEQWGSDAPTGVPELSPYPQQCLCQVIFQTTFLFGYC